MKTSAPGTRDAVAPIILLSEQGHDDASDAAVLTRARAFAEPLLRGHLLDSGEDTLAHADAVANILRCIGAAASLQAAVYLAYAADHLSRPEEAIANAFGESYGAFVGHTRKLVALLRSARDAQVGAGQRSLQTDRVRKMLLSFSRDLRVVLLRLASRLQTLRHYAHSKLPCPPPLAAESMDVYAPLGNRLGIWQFKWEIEDLSFRYLEPEQYRSVSRLLDEKRVERERSVESLRRDLSADLARHGLHAEVTGRPKHLYSIWKKMRGKSLEFAEIHDIRALRVIVSGVAECYAVLAHVHERFRPVAGEFDDYIAKPKANGYQSLHTVVRDAQGRAIEIQIRTRDMHERAEHGVAAHWAYKEAGSRGHAGAHASAELAARVTEARKAVLRQLLAWERDFVAQGAADPADIDDRIYVFTPQATVVELPGGATPVDFAYAVHTELGHRCRGARVDAVMVPLNTPLRNGQTIEIVSAKDGGPSLDWLNAELGYLKSARSKAKVRAWFNAAAQRETVARGRESVERLLQREGKTAIKLVDLAAQLGFRSADALFEVVGKDEYSIRNIEVLLRPPEPVPADGAQGIGLKRSRAQAQGGALVVGLDSLLTSLARCCRPAPPDAVGGYVTRGRGVAIHRLDCANYKQMLERNRERAIEVTWDEQRADASAAYPIDVLVHADDRQGLLRDISEVFAKEKMNLVGVRSESGKGANRGIAWMTFTVEVPSSLRLKSTLHLIAKVPGVHSARRR